MEKDPEIVNRYLLSVQEAVEKKLSVFCVRERFFVLKTGIPVGQPTLFETDSVLMLRQFVKDWRMH